MYNTIKIGIVGGDRRQTVIAKRFADMGFETAVWGAADNLEIGNAVRCSDWVSAVKKSRVVILPLPITHDGISIYTSGKENYKLLLSQLLDEISESTLLFGGRIDESVKLLLENKRIKYFDYFSSEDLQIRNALPTAEGALEIALRELPVTLLGANALVCGYGRIGKILSALLSRVRSRVTVAARSREDIAYIKALGYETARFGENDSLVAFREADVIFNTVPSKIIDSKILGEIKENCLIIDLASGDGGVDYTVAGEKGIKAVHALGLPGKVAPVTAGNIIFECVLEELCKEGVIARK